MTLRHTFAVAALSALLALTGCATREAAKPVATPPQAPVTETRGEQSVTSTSPTSTLREEAVQGDSSIVAASAERSAAPKGVDAGLAPIYFDFDSHLLGSAAREVLSHNALWLKQNPQARVTIEGHADERGSDDYNLALSEKRALAAQQYLNSLGVAAARMDSVGYGEEKPAAAGHDESAWSKNRRTEFVVTK